VNLRRSSLALVALVGAVHALPAGAAPPVNVAVLPLQVNSLDEHKYLREGLADMLTSRIGRMPGVAVLRVDDEKVATSDPAAARNTARELGAAYVVYGSFTAFGGGASLDLECSAVGAAGAAAPARGVFVQAGTLGEIIPELDGLAAKIARYATSGGAEAPAVAAGPGTVKAASGGASDGDLRELDARIRALERAVFSDPNEVLEESDLR
jgi:hypothetical protein